MKQFVLSGMPKIYQYLNFIIRFYTNDHFPVHVHVQLQQREMKVEFNIAGDNVTLLFKKVRGKKPLTQSEAGEVAVFLKAYYKEIVSKWEMVFIYHKSVKCDIVNKRLNKRS